jgi:hypothetical protein
MDCFVATLLAMTANAIAFDGRTPHLLPRPAALCKHQSARIGRTAKLACQFERIVAFRTRRQQAGKLQVSDDKSSAFYGGAINVNRCNIWAVGASLGYNFGPAQLTVWALDEVSANAPGGSPQLPPGPLITKGFSAFAQLSYRLWAPDPPVAAPKSPLYHK